jgi:glycosyltransferase involved in cell wall biosynthesis
MIKPLVTVCITTYNRESVLPFAIKSVQDQTYENIEIIIVDDFSEDNTEKIVKDFQEKDNRIRYIKHESNKGLACARNTAIESATGVFFTFLDDDDLWESDFVEEFVRLASDYDKNWCFCCGNKGGSRCLVPKFEDNVKKYILEGYTPPVAAQFYYLETVRDVGGYNPKIKSGVDHDLWLTLGAGGYKIKSLEKCLAIDNPHGVKDRITTNFQKRVKGIESSLEVWKPLIIENFGEEFFLHFKKNYFYHIYKKLFTYSLKEKEILRSFKFFIKNPQKLRLLKEVFSYLFIKKDCLEVKPSFQTFKK